MSNVFAPQAGFMQTTYKDQMGTALPGQLVHASDIRLVDTYVVSPTIGAMGIEAGLGFVAPVIPADQREGFREGINMKYAMLPATGATAADFEGITVRNQQMDTNVDGRACWFANRLCNGLRSRRVGGRMWAQVANGSTTVDGKVYWIISNTTAHGKTIGAFSGVAMGADTVELKNAVFKSAVDSNSGFSLAIIELAEEAA